MKIKKIKLSKSQWEKIGNESGWRKSAQNVAPAPAPQQAAVQPQQAPAAQPAQGQKQPNASGWTFNKLMQDANFKQTFQTLKNQKANEKKILQYWQSMGIQYKSIPEILEVIGSDTI